jgi:hypothetical protein
MLIQLFNQNPPINVTGDLIEVRGGSLGTFLIKLGSKGNLEVIIQLYKEEALAVQSKLNEWNPFWRDYLASQIEELKARVAELEKENDRLTQYIESLEQEDLWEARIAD